MKHTPLLAAVILAGMFACGPLAAERPQRLDLDGRLAVVRVYSRQYQYIDDDHVIVTAPVQDRTIICDFEGLNKSAFVLILGEDQKDEMVKLAIGERVFSRAYREGLRFNLPDTLDPFAGRELVARIYKDWRDAPKAFETAAVKVFGKKVTFDFDDVDDDAVVAVFGQDQQDDALRRRIGDRIYGWAYKRGLAFSLPGKEPAEHKDYCWMFVNALGEPVPNADVEMYLTNEDRRIFVGRATLDDNGRWRTSFCVCEGRAKIRISGVPSGFGSTRPLFVLSEPNHGVAEAKLSRVEREYEHVITVPFVPAGSEAEQRSAWGVVVDPDNQPVSGALVEASSLVLPGGGRVHRRGISAVRTDRQGRFRLYMPVHKEAQNMGELIPPKTQYGVRVTPAPHGLGLLAYRGEIPNGQESVITLERPETYFHTFVFEDEKGPIRDRNLFYKIHLWIKRQDKPSLRPEYEDWKKGGMFPLGRFEAELSGRRELRFEPIEVTGDSPERLVFRVPTAKTYYGRVVHGITGEPMEGTFVIDMDGLSTQRNLSVLTKEQWDQVRAMAQAGATSERAGRWMPEPLCYSFSRIVCTDKLGKFELKIAPGRSFSKIVIFDANYLTVIVARAEAEEREDNSFEVPLTRLFPAAKVLVEPWIRGYEQERHPAVWPRWVISKKGNPPWVSELLANVRFDMFMDWIRKDFCLHPNERHCFYVPAGVSMQVQLHLNPRGGGDDGYAPMTIPADINLRQGESLDLGRHEIKPTLTVFVDVTDPAGSALEGVPVTAFDQYGRDTSVTDNAGIAIFALARDAKGKFIVEYKPGDTEPAELREAISYQIRGPEDANSIFTMHVSDQLLKALAK
ncbi:MAG: carboxypeptidase-like regulatory domain-containing protein [Planctomycetota bacterium]|jgi:hypothetical protein